MISFGPLDPGSELPGLLAASAAQFGVGSYQRLPRYLDWLYGRNPAGRSAADCLVARRGGEVVGAMHRMVLPLQGGGALAVLHNHFIADDLRSGPGALLLRRAAKGAEASFAPGVQAPLDQVYRRLGFDEHLGWWLWRPLAPAAVAAQLVRARLGGSPPLRVDLARLRRRLGADGVTVSPDEADLDRLCGAMRAGAPGRPRVDWTPPLVRWRYFDPLGPRHLLLRSTAGLAVIAPGRRRGLGTARLMELTAPGDPALLRLAHRAMRAAGAALGLAFTTDPAVRDALRARGWRTRGGTHSFTAGAPAPALGPAATDVGFEAIATEFR